MLVEIAHLEDRNPKLTNEFHWPDSDAETHVSRRIKKPVHLNKKESEAKARLDELRMLLARVEELHEQNPMLGLRGCRLGITFPEDHRDAGVRAVLEAAVAVKAKGGKPHVEIMIRR